MKNAMYCRGSTGRALALITWLLVAGGVAAQSPQPASKPTAPAKAKATQPAKKPAATDFKLILEPRAMDLLKAVSAKLAAAKSMSFTAVVGYEYPSKLGPPIVYSTRYDVTMQRPDKLRILMPGDGPASEFYYDGKTMIAFAPAENLAAVADAPPTIDAALRQAFEKAAIYLPVHRYPRRRSVRRADERRDPRLLRRSFRGDGRHEDRHGGVGQPRRVPAGLDRRRRQAAAPDPRNLRRGPARAAPRDGVFELATGPGDPAGHVRVGEGAGSRAHGVRGTRTSTQGGETVDRKKVEDGGTRQAPAKSN